MRADRLLSMLLLLQTHGRMSAGKLAAELEVSERTIYRDIEALSTAGIPVYGEPGPEGGYALLDNYRTRLTGLSEGEVRAFFMLGIPEPLMKLGVGQELKTALLKLAAALPGEHLHTEKHVRQRFYLDSMWWQQVAEPVAHLGTVHQAVLADRKLCITRRLPFPGEMEQLVDPYGLVAKAGIWYLVYSVHGRIGTHRVDSLLDVRLSEETFARPADFDLEVFWKDWCAEQELLFAYYTAKIRTTPDLLPVLRRHFGEHINTIVEETGPPDAEGRITLELPFESLEAARERLLGYGRAVEVLWPPALRRSVLDYAEQIVNLYSP